MTKILIIEDDKSILTGLKDNLEMEHFDVLSETDGETGFQKALNEKPELILLDVMLPSKNGFDICKDLRKNNVNVPIIMLTAKGEEADKVLGLELGADDYITKPFSIRELLARVKAILRRRKDIEKDFEEFCFANVKLNFKKMEAYRDKERIDLSLKEFEILKYFISHEGEVVSRDTLLDKVWGYDVYPTTRTVDNYILMLRKKDRNRPLTSQTSSNIPFRRI